MGERYVRNKIKTPIIFLTSSNLINATDRINPSPAINRVKKKTKNKVKGAVHAVDPPLTAFIASSAMRPIEKFTAVAKVAETVKIWGGR
jgi:hypothetical protein